MQDLEFIISQYLDGDLSPTDRVALESRLKTDAEAKKLFGEYCQIDLAMKSIPLPDFRWDALSQSISAAVDEAHEVHTARAYRMPAWIRKSMMPMALAASLLIVAGIGIQLFNARQSPTGWPSSTGGAGATAGSTTVVAFQTDKTTGPIVEDVSISPGPAANIEPVMVYGSDAASSASHITVVSGVAPAHDIQPAASFYDMQ